MARRRESMARRRSPIPAPSRAMVSQNVSSPAVQSIQVLRPMRSASESVIAPSISSKTCDAVSGKSLMVRPASFAASGTIAFFAMSMHSPDRNQAMTTTEYRTDLFHRSILLEQFTFSHGSVLGLKTRPILSKRSPSATGRAGFRAESPDDPAAGRSPGLVMRCMSER